MADQDTPPPPKPKPGSLRDRIAAFESKPAASAQSPPAPRPKPGNVQWKPKPVATSSPPSSPTPGAKAESPGQSPERKAVGSGGFSAADAKQSIGQGGSLKERMAALQGRGGFGAPPPPTAPKPATDKPKWKPPPVVSPPAVEEHEPKAEIGTLHAAPDIGQAREEQPVEAQAEHMTEVNVNPAKQDQDQDQDSEEEERQRRANIAARMARLGGARLGMAPPVIGKKPEVRKPETPTTPAHQTEEEKGVQDAPLRPDSAEIQASPHLRHGSVRSGKDEVVESEGSSSLDVALSPPGPAKLDPIETKQLPNNSSQSSLLQPDSASTASNPSRSPPNSMPVPAVPRRAGPPRKKPAAKSPSPAVTEVLEEGVQIKESPANTPALEIPEAAIVESSAPERMAVPEHERHDSTAQEEKAVTENARNSALSSEIAQGDAEEKTGQGPPSGTIESISRAHSTDQLEPDEIGEMPGSYDDDNSHIATTAISPPVAQADTAKEEVAGEEEDEVTRRKRIAERLAKSGGLNPFAAPPPAFGVKQPSSIAISPTSSEVAASPRSPIVSPVNTERRSSVRKPSADTPSLQQSPIVASPSSSSNPIRKHSSDIQTVHDESPPSFPGTERKSSVRKASTDSSKVSISPTSPRKMGSLGAESDVVHESLDDRTLFEQPVLDDLAIEEVVDQGHIDELEIDHRSEVVNKDVDDDEHPYSAADEYSRGWHEAGNEIEVQSVYRAHNEYVPSSHGDDLSLVHGGHMMDQRELITEEHQESDSQRDADTAVHDEETEQDENDEMAPPRFKRSLPPPPQVTANASADSDEEVDIRHVRDQRLPTRQQSMAAVPIPPRHESFALPLTKEHTTATARPSRRSLPPPPLPTSVDSGSVDVYEGGCAADGASAEEEQRFEDPDKHISSEPTLTESQYEVEDEESETYSPMYESSRSPPITARRLDQSPPPLRPRPTPQTMADDTDRNPSPRREDSGPPPLRPRPTVDDTDRPLTPGFEDPSPPPLLPRPSAPSVEDEKDSKFPPTPPRPPHPSRRSIPPPPRAMSSLPKLPEAWTPLKDSPTTETDEGAGHRSGFSRSHVPTPLNDEPEHEVLDESDGDPIDPAFHSPSRSPSNTSPQASLRSPKEVAPPSPLPSANEVVNDGDEQDNEQARRQTIAERMAKLGGIRFGAPPPVQRPQRPPPEVTEIEPEQEISSEPVPTEEEVLISPQDEEEEEEKARKARIALKLAGMGGMRFGMLPQVTQAPPSPHLRMESDESAMSAKTVSTAPPPRRHAVPPPPPPPPPPLPPAESDIGSEEQNVTDSELVDIEAEESGMEEVSYEDAEEESPPPVPSRAERAAPQSPMDAPPALPAGRRAVSPAARPPIPSIPSALSPRKDEARSPFGSARRASSEPEPNYPPLPPPPPPHGDYVMVDGPKPYESEVPPPPPARVSRGPPPRTAPRPPPTPEKSESTTKQSQWGLPNIPSGSLELSRGEDLSSSAWSEDSTTYPGERPQPPPAVTKAPARAGEVQLNADELLALWGRVGVHVGEVANTLYEKSKRSLIGDGTFTGFVHAVLNQVPNAAIPPSQSYGHLVYSQMGSTVNKRASDIMPGDVISLTDAKLKGHKGLQMYNQSVGAGGEPVVGVVSEFEHKKIKVKVYQANQHVGGQTVELMSYRLEDLKSGNVKIFRVAEV